MDSELKDLKSVLRSLVVSSPAQVDVRSLQRDYRNMMGVPIPLAKYGYRDVLTFLKERCSDCFIFQGMPSNPVLTLIVPDSLKHIDQFVQKQKPSAVTKMKGKRRSVHESIGKTSVYQSIGKTSVYKSIGKTSVLTTGKTSVYESTGKTSVYESIGKTSVYESMPKPPAKLNLICQTFNTKHNSTQDLNKTQLQVKPPDIQRDQIDNSNNKSTNPIYNSTKKMTENLKSLLKLKFEDDNTNSHVVESGCNETKQNYLKKRLPMYDSSQYLDLENCTEPDKVSSKEDNDSGRLTSSSQSSTKKTQLQELKNEICELINEHEAGIWCTDLMRLYRERYSRELNFNRFGYNNINGLLAAMDDRVAFCSEAGGVRLRRAAALPPPAPPAPSRPPRVSSLRALPVDPDDALPGVAYDADVFPADCTHYLESVPAASLRGVGPGAMLEVAVGEVYSPSHFWLQRLGPAHALALDDLMDRMSEYYTRGEGRARVLSRSAVRAGHYCSSVYDRDWHRSLIVKVIDADTVKVRHVDYGTVDTVRAAELKPLLRCWAALPAQALRARLAGLRPGAGGRRWPHAAAAHFLQLVRDKRFVANVVALDPEEAALETFLIDTSGADDVCVSALMIRAGHADARADSALRTGECYLRPRFDALESGLTPNYAEIHRYLADGISLEFVEAYRAHVLAALPAAPDGAPAPRASPPAPAPSRPSPPMLINRVPLLRVDSPLPCSTPPDSPAPSPAAGATTPSPSPPSRPAPSSAVRPPSPPAPVVSPLPSPLPMAAAPPSYAVVQATRLPAPPAPPGPAGGVRLTAQECEMYTLLNSMDPQAAYCYLLSALRRAGVAAAGAGAGAPAAYTPRVPQAAPQFILNPHAPEFHIGFPSAFGQAGPLMRFVPPPPGALLPPYFRPPAPPGF